MKLHWLAVLLVVGAFLVGCTGDRQAQEQIAAPTAATPQQAADIADKAIASMEAALQGTDKDAMMKAAQQLNLALGTLRGKLVAKDDEAEQKAHTEGKPAPARLDVQLSSAMEASSSIMGAVQAETPDVARAKTLLAQVKSSVDAARKALQ